MPPSIIAWIGVSRSNGGRLLLPTRPFVGRLVGKQQVKSLVNANQGGDARQLILG